MELNLNDLNKEKKYILACSGGADSVFLGEILCQTGFKNIIIAHFNHQLREKEADRDEKFSQKMAKKWSYDFISEKWQKPEQSEEKARKARYNFLYKIYKQKKANFILLAHHFDDNAETILFNLLRGTGLKGASGIKKQDGVLIRPLLDIKKTEIIKYLEKNKIPFQTDSSNFESTFTRNFLRNELFPLIEKRFPEAKNSLARFGAILKNSQDLIEQKAQKWLQKNQSETTGINRKKFLNQPKIIQAEILRIFWQPASLEFEQIENLLQFIKTANSNKKIIIKQKTLKIFGDNFFIE